VTTVLEIDDEALATARAAIDHLPADQLAVFLAQALRRAAENDPVWLPIMTRPNEPATYEVRGLLHPEANSPGRLEVTHWRHTRERREEYP
jgi:hypothetical protein